MAKTAQKGKILFILRYLQKKTDKDNAVTINEIITELANNNIKAERKSVYNDINLLREFGFNIIMHRSHDVRYYMEPSPLETSELLLVTDAIQACPFIPRRKVNELIRKLGYLTSENKAKEIDRLIYIPERRRDLSETLYKKIDILQNAIQKNRQISFLDNTAPTEICLCEQVSPFLLVLSEGIFYLIAGDHRAENGLVFYRLDQISDLSLLQIERDEIVTYTGDIDFSLQQYAEGLFSKTKEAIQITLKIKKYLLKQFTDKYKDLHITGKSGEYITIEITQRLTSDFILSILQSGEDIQILYPEQAVKMVPKIR